MSQVFALSSAVLAFDQAEIYSPTVHIYACLFLHLDCFNTEALPIQMTLVEPLELTKT